MVGEAAYARWLLRYLMDVRREIWIAARIVIPNAVGSSKQSSRSCRPGYVARQRTVEHPDGFLAWIVLRPLVNASEACPVSRGKMVR